MHESPIKLMIVDDHQLFIDGIKAILRWSKDIEIVGEALSGEETLKQLSEFHQLPDVLITDISMPGMKGDELVEKITANFPSIKILALSMHNDINTIDRMIAAGVKGYILKNTGRKELIIAINTIFNNENFYSEEVKAEMVGKYIRTTKPASENQNKTNPGADVFLSRRERQIIKLILEGKSNSDIGEELRLSVHTITSHRKNFYSKLNVSNTAQLIDFIKVNNMIL